MAKVIGNENDITVGDGLVGAGVDKSSSNKTSNTSDASQKSMANAQSDSQAVQQYNLQKVEEYKQRVANVVSDAVDYINLQKLRYSKEYKNATNKAIEKFENDRSNPESEQNLIEEWKKNVQETKINYSQRVSLNIAPIDKNRNVMATMNESEWNERINYILGSYSKLDFSKFDIDILMIGGLLRELFSRTRGIVFQYTPTIKMQHKVNYDAIEILHSNLSINQYKNTPPPGITLTGIFTADNEENAKYMYGVMCFLRAMTKCEFGMKSRNEKGGNEGVPPPTLYLNGWGNMINNVPVVITGFDIDLPKESHYVYLEDYDVWLPTQMEFTISLNIQFNLNKYKEQFDLNEYKLGVLGMDTDGNITTVNTLNYDDSKYNLIYYKQGEIVDKRKFEPSKLYTTKKATRFNGSGWTW